MSNGSGADVTYGPHPPFGALTLLDQLQAALPLEVRRPSSAPLEAEHHGGGIEDALDVEFAEPASARAIAVVQLRLLRRTSSAAPKRSPGVVP